MNCHYCNADIHECLELRIRYKPFRKEDYSHKVLSYRKMQRIDLCYECIKRFYNKITQPNEKD